MKFFVCLALFSFAICTVFAAPNGSKDELNLSKKLKETEEPSSRYGASFASPQGFGNPFGQNIPNQISQGPGYGLPRPPSNAFGPPSPQFGQFSPPSPQFGPSFPRPPQFGPSFPPPPQFGPSFPPSSQFGPSFPPSSQFGPFPHPSPQFGPFYPPTFSYGPNGPPSFGNSFPSFGPPPFGFPQNPWYNPGYGVQPYGPSFPYYPHHAHQRPHSSSPRPGPYYYNGFDSYGSGSTPRPSYYFNGYSRMFDDSLPIPEDEDVLSEGTGSEEQEESNSDFDPDSVSSLVFV